jgi:hypothetical protein
LEGRFEVVKRDPGTICLGIEIDLYKVLWSMSMAKLKDADDRARSMWDDMFDTSLEGFDVAYVFL